MILSILQHTPVWVFLLLITLVALGIRRLRANTIGVRALLVLPIAMTGFSLFGVTQVFGAGLVPLAAWAVAFAAVLALAAVVPTDPGVRYMNDRTLHIPGSWLPLALMMAIFFLRYAVAVLLAMHPGLHDDTAFVVGVAVLYGMTSGSFAARALLTLRGAVAARTTASTFAAA